MLDRIGLVQRNTAGDVGENITAGHKQIIWHVLESREELVGSAIQFKVVANGRKGFEPEMVFVEGGSFQMRSNDGEFDERPVHNVWLSSFYICKFEVTQAEWKEVMGNCPFCFTGCDDCPVEGQSWNYVQNFIAELNRQTGRNYRLPTEAKWEYSAPGGKLSSGYSYAGSNDLSSVAWFSQNSGWQPHSVGEKVPNELGIYDMTGNVYEWCSDLYGPYPAGQQTNPIGAKLDGNRVRRGCGCSNFIQQCRVTDRTRSAPDTRLCDTGFRLVLTPVQ